MTESRTETALIQWECQQLLNRVTMLTDKADWQALVLCYAEDGLLARPSDPDNPIRGRANLLASLQARPPRTTAHLTGNAVFDVITPHQVFALSRVWLISGPEQTGNTPVPADSNLLIGTFTDQLVRIERQWFIAQRQGSLELRYETSQPL